MSLFNRRQRRAKIHGHHYGTPMDRNAKGLLIFQAIHWSAAHRQPGEHTGPITRTMILVLKTLLWEFHNAKTGWCFPSYKAIAAKAKCSRSTVAAAVAALEAAGILTWVHRIIRDRVQVRNENGRLDWIVRIIRTSNAYAFTPQKPQKSGESENQPGTNYQDSSKSYLLPRIDPTSPLERALAGFGRVVQARESGIQAEGALCGALTG